MNKFRITVASPPDRENLVAEISCERIQLAEIFNEHNEMIIQIYHGHYNDKNYWKFLKEKRDVQFQCRICLH